MSFTGLMFPSGESAVAPSGSEAQELFSAAYPPPIGIFRSTRVFVYFLLSQMPASPVKSLKRKWKRNESWGNMHSLPMKALAAWICVRSRVYLESEQEVQVPLSGMGRYRSQQGWIDNHSTAKWQLLTRGRRTRRAGNPCFSPRLWGTF